MIALSLIQLTWNNQPFVWSIEVEKTFTNLRWAFTFELIVAHVNASSQLLFK